MFLFWQALLLAGKFSFLSFFQESQTALDAELIFLFFPA